MPVPSPSDLVMPFATAYFEAAQAGADMRSVANALEMLRSQLAQATEPYEVWAAFDEQIGAADLNRFMPALVKLARAFQSAVISAQVVDVRKAFDEDRERGWTQWLDAYVRSFDAAGWRGVYGAAIAQQALVDSPYPDWPVERIQKVAQAVSYERWPEAYDWFLFLTELELPTVCRARFLVIVAEIQIFHFLQPSKAKTYLQKATELSADLLQARNGWGEYRTALGEWDDARQIFGEIVKAYPKRPEGYVGMGDCDEKTGQFDSAESWYYQAVLNAPGSPHGYRSLALLWLRPDQPKERADPAKVEELIQPLLLRWKALTDRPAVASLGVGISYKNRKQFDLARRYLDEAIQCDPPYALAYVWLGNTDIDEANQMENDSPAAARLYHSARDLFNTSIQLAPGALDGYWAVSQLYVQQQNWPAAEEWMSRCLQLHPEWECFVRVGRAEVLRRQGCLTGAEDDLERSLSLESFNQPALDVMSALVADYWKKGQKDAARRLWDKWKEKSDPNREYLYYNQLGNWSYEAGDYASAVESYRRAIQAKETDSVLHSNLSQALQKLRVPGERCQELREAIAELARARALAPQEPLIDKITALRAELTFLQFYGEAVAALDPVVDPIRVYIDWATMREVLVGNDLAPQAHDAVNGVRTRLKQKLGFNLPGVSFRDLQPPGCGKYRITFNESITYEGSVNAGSVLGSVLARLEEVVPDHMADWLGHDGVALMLKGIKCSAAAAIVQDLAQLTRFVGLLRSRLASRQSIEPLAPISEDFERRMGAVGPKSTATRNGSGVSSQMASQRFPQLAVRVGPTGTALLTALKNDSTDLRKGLFNELGIPVPPIEFELDVSLPENEAVLLLNGSRASTIEKADVESVRVSIENCAAGLMVPEVTEYYLAKLGDRYPVLIRAARAQLDTEEVTDYLRRRLLKRQSIKNLPGILEEQLQEGRALESNAGRALWSNTPNALAQP